MVNSVNSSFEKKFFMWIKDALVWIRATDPNLLIKNYLTFRFIDGLKIDWSEKQWGHKRGHISLLCFIICFLSLTYFDIWVRPSHQKYVNRPQLRSFFMPEIRATQIFSAVFFHLVQSILIPLRIPNQVCLRLSIKDSALSENLIHPPGTIFIAIVLASWTMFNHK